MDAVTHDPETGEVLTGGVATVKLSGAAAQLKSIVDRIERLAEEVAGLQEDIRDIYKEAKGNGYDPAALRMVIAERKKAGPQRTSQLELFRLYMDTIGG